ncbi:carbamate kinase [Maioricimonas sp. JC845]|uniref:carbamate kinase n=1 Tax=Maioricimonas sp. JC845 TaxID=3232138 RepID=UPI00345B05A5
MIPDRTVIVLGGNAFVRPGESLTMAGQFRFAAEVVSQLVPIVTSAGTCLITHGNGPQVGHMLVRVEEALGKAYAIPLEVCVAESEGELGYVLGQTLLNTLRSRNVRRPVVSLLTQVLVDADDPAFETPTKPVGPAYSAEQAERLRKSGFQLVEETGRGYRRVVPSPRPLRIIEMDVIQALLDMGVLVVAAGGGGIPVIEQDGALKGVDAVIDKDLSSALLADAIDAELMLILTGVPCVYRGFASKQPEPLPRLSPARARALLDAGEFPPGSMGPKIQAALQFVSRPGRRVIICDPPSVQEACAGRAGTTIHSD